MTPAERLEVIRTVDAIAEAMARLLALVDPPDEQPQPTIRLVKKEEAQP